MSRLVVVLALLLVAGLVFIQPVQSHSVANTTVTFDREISRIIKKRCIQCHSDQNLGFPLTSYEQTRPWTGSIHEEVLRRHMPPWRAVAGYGDFANDASLTSRELQFLVAWIDGNGPKGKEKIIYNFETMKTPEHERIKGDFDRWQLGKPDMLTSLAPNAIAPGEGDMVRRVDIDLGLRAERRVRGLEFKPGDRRVVRGATFRVRETGQWIGSWTPWHPAMVLPLDAVYKVPAGAHIEADIYYRSSDAPVEDRGTLAWYFAPKATSTAVDVMVEARQASTGATRVGTLKYAGQTTLPSATTVVALNPEVPEGTSAFSVSAKRPNGVTTPLLLVRDPLREWPTPYLLRTPVRLEAGTELLLIHHLDSAVGGTAPERIGLTVTTIAAPPQ